jgi:hypothetical protein
MTFLMDIAAAAAACPPSGCLQALLQLSGGVIRGSAVVCWASPGPYTASFHTRAGTMHACRTCCAAAVVLALVSVVQGAS